MGLNSGFKGLTELAAAQKKLSDARESRTEDLKHCKEQNIPLSNLVKFTDSFFLPGPGKSAPATFMFSGVRNL